jgi:hypothetical protein
MFWCVEEVSMCTVSFEFSDLVTVSAPFPITLVDEGGDAPADCKDAIAKRVEMGHKHLCTFVCLY